MSEMEEAFIKANANPEHIAENLAEVLRDLMRATAVQINSTDAVLRATEKWEFVLKLLAQCKEPLSWRSLFEDAIAKLRPDQVQGDSVDRAIQEIARAGMSYYVERSGRGFASKKHVQFVNAIKHYEEEVREHKRQVMP